MALKKGSSPAKKSAKKKASAKTSAPAKPKAKAAPKVKAPAKVVAPKVKTPAKRTSTVSRKIPSVVAITKPGLPARISKQSVDSISGVQKMVLQERFKTVGKIEEFVRRQLPGVSVTVVPGRNPEREISFLVDGVRLPDEGVFFARKK